MNTIPRIQHLKELKEGIYKIVVLPKKNSSNFLCKKKRKPVKPILPLNQNKTKQNKRIFFLNPTTVTRVHTSPQNITLNLGEVNRVKQCERWFEVVHEEAVVRPSVVTVRT